MESAQKIEFREISTSATDFLHELNDPALLKSRSLPPQATVELRKQQVTKLRENIQLLTAKREEFNRKMELYIENLRALIRSVEKSIHLEREKRDGEPGAAHKHSTLVRCLSCDTQQFFRELAIIFARESDESFYKPTEVYVLDGSNLKKGHFSCQVCGTGHLVIRSV